MEPTPAGNGASALTADTIAEQIAELTASQRRRASAISRGGPPSDDLLAALTELDVAHEELDVAQEELRAQQEQVEQLLQERLTERGWRDRLGAALPIPALSTSRVGVIRDVNAAAGMLLQVRPSRLVGKPITAFVEPTDRPRVRDVLLQLDDQDDARISVSLRPRNGQPIGASLTAVSEYQDGDRHIRWIAVANVSGDSPSRMFSHADGLTVVGAIAELSKLPIQSDIDDQPLLRRVAGLAHSALSVADGVSVTLGSPEQPDLLATDSALAERVDGVQYAAGEGPCVEAYAVGQTVRTGQLSRDPRWPRVGARAADSGVESVLAVPIGGSSGRAGVLNIYARQGDAFSDAEARVAELFTAATAAVLQDRRERADMRRLGEQLEQALVSRAVIDQAKGILMVAYRCSADRAFRLLARMSQQRNVKLNELAKSIVEGVAVGD